MKLTGIISDSTKKLLLFLYGLILSQPLSRADNEDKGLRIISCDPVSYEMPTNRKNPVHMPMYKYVIENNSEDDALLWFSNITENAFIRYFYRYTGPYTIPIMTAFYEEGSTLVFSNGSGYFMRPFIDFYKIIESGDSFTVYFIDDADVNKETTDKLIHLRTKTDVESECGEGRICQMKCHEGYKADFIILRTSDIPEKHARQNKKARRLSTTSSATME